MVDVSPVFFDHFGFLIFVYILIISIYDLKNSKKLARGRWSSWLLLIFSVLGILADGFILYRYYFG